MGFARPTEPAIDQTLYSLKQMLTPDIRRSLDAMAETISRLIRHRCQFGNADIMATIAKAVRKS
jgi:hypothetical protein